MRFGEEPLSHVWDRDTVHIEGKGFLPASQPARLSKGRYSRDL